MTKRILSLLLMLTMLLPIAACGNTENPGADTNRNNSSVTEPTSATETEFFPSVEKKDYQGKEFCMIGFTSPGEWYYAEKAGGGVLSDAIFDMNSAVEDYLNVDIVYSYVSKNDAVGGGAAIYQKIEPSLIAGDDEYQLCLFDPFYSYYSMINNGLAYDISTLPGVDLDQNYWKRDVMESVAIDNHTYIGLSDLCKYRPFVFYFNKDLFTDVKREIPYQSVRNGTWTQAELFALTQGLYRDDDGDGTKNNEDVYGFAGFWDYGTAGLLQGAGFRVAQRNEEGRLERTLDYGSEQLIDFYGKLYEWSMDESVYYWGYAQRNDSTKILKFDTGRAYVTLDELGTGYVHVDFRFGILPMPKYEVSQKTYAHLNWGYNFTIPSTIQNPDMVGAVVEMMSYYSSTGVYETYYDTVLGSYASDSPDDREMIEMICDTVVCDPGMPWCDNCDALKSILYTTSFGVLQGQKNIATYIRKNSQQVDRFFENMFLDS